MDRPSWTQYFMGLAHYVSIRSHDEETKVGCVIVNKNKNVIGMGYNGFPQGCADEGRPTKRPYKYPYMVHAEENAISNMVYKPASDQLTAYITHHPCNSCLKLLWQNNIYNIVVPESKKAHAFSHDDRLVFDFLKQNGLQLVEIKFDFSFFKNDTVLSGV